MKERAALDAEEAEALREAERVRVWRHYGYSSLLEYLEIRPISQGGTHTLENIISLCESHHIAHHAGALIIEGTATNATFTRRAHNAFAIAERIAETKAALRTLGFDKHEVRTAIEKTRAHVGTAELTLEQWIKVALSYCPKPRAS